MKKFFAVLAVGMILLSTAACNRKVDTSWTCDYKYLPYVQTSLTRQQAMYLYSTGAWNCYELKLV